MKTAKPIVLEPRPSEMRTQFEAARPDLICTHELDGRVLTVNSAACEALGMSDATLRGMTIQNLLPPGAASRFRTYMQTLERHGFAVGMMRVTTADGSPRIWECRSTLDSDGTATPIVRGVARDVTEREEAFKAIRRSEEHFRSIIENVSDIIAIIGLDGDIQYESPSVERVLGYPRKGVVGRPFVDLAHPDDAGRAAEFLASQIADPGAIQTIELRVRHRGGTSRSLEIVAKNLIKDGRASAIVMNARDVTERKLLEAQLIQAKRLGGLGRLAATVAHEFNNVLMGMQPFAELIQRPKVTPQVISQAGSHIANSIQRGKRIVLDILRFSQPHVPATTAIDLRQWWETFAPEAEVVLGNMTSIVSTIPGHSLYVIADRIQLSQVLANLVANARDAMPSGGRLIVEANELGPDATFPFGVVPHPERFVQLSITDTGHGMAPEVLERVFEPLYTTRQSGGTGLGLAVAHQIMTQHGGHIFVESEPGRGSTFHLFLPRAATVAAEKVDLGQATGKAAARKVLIVEDDELIVEGISVLLTYEGIKVEAVGNGNEVEQAMARFRPDLVLLDYGLPGMDGSEIYALIRERDSSIPVIFATGHGDRRILHDSLNDPRTRFLQKPFEAAALLKMIGELEAESTP